MAGQIHAEAQKYLAHHRNEVDVLKPFLATGFDVTWANRRRWANTYISTFFLKADDELTESYGFEYEILLAYSKYQVMEPRTLRAVDHVLATDPAKGRVESVWYFLVTEASNVTEWVTSYLLEQKESRIVVPFCNQELQSQPTDKWTVRNQLHRHFLTLDRFKYTLPLYEDTYFFGRANEVGQLMDFVKRGENAGLFGLRKTGKTSVLLKLQRLFASSDDYDMVIIDAQSPSVRHRHWNQLLEYVTSQVLKRINLENKCTFDELTATEDFENSLSRYFSQSRKKRLAVALDEIEWISPNTTKDPHWNEEFLDFWQVIRSYQMNHRNLSVIIAGVNPSMAEVDRFGVYQNPLFGIVTPTFLAGLQQGECDDMVQKIGKVMGLKFKPDALRYVFDQYGGHPLLTRLACSNVAELAKIHNTGFPVTVTLSRMERDKQIRDRELVFYVRHVVSELEEFYPEEYGLLEMLAVDSYDKFLQAIKIGNHATHLFQYGIVAGQDYPYITCKVVDDYVAMENARREGRRTKYRLIPLNERKEFVQVRMRHIVDDMRNLERSIKVLDYPQLFGPNSFPAAEKLFDIEPPSDEATFGSALSTLYQCFVESIENYGTSLGLNQYFWSDIKQNYPDLHEAFHRIRVYRHNAHHLQLVPAVEKTLRRFLNKDLTNGEVTAISDKYWWLFQRCLDELFRAIQRETNRLEA